LSLVLPSTAELYTFSLHDALPICKLTKAGGVLVAADVVMSGQMKPSHYINGGMLAASSTGVGSIVAGVWFIADMGTGAYNYYFSDDGFRTLSDVIDESSFGQSITVDMYDGLY